MTWVKKRAECPHQLPISSGWSGGGWSTEPSCTVWCGRCQESVDASADKEWDARYLRSHGYSPHARIRAEYLERNNQALLQRQAGL